MASLALARQQWDAGQRRLRDAADPLYDRIVDRAVDELRKRLGGPFTAQELADLYDRVGTDFATSIAVAMAPDEPDAWDAVLIGDAAYGRYLREASDWAGGRLLES